MSRWHFITRYMTKLGPKSGKFPYFYKNPDISKTPFGIELELRNFLMAEIWTSSKDSTIHFFKIRISSKKNQIFGLKIRNLA